MKTIKYADLFTLMNGSESFEDELIVGIHRRVTVNIRKARMVEQGQGRIEAN